VVPYPATEVVELHIAPSDVAVVNLPGGTTIRAVRESGTTDYAPWYDDLPLIARVYGEAFEGVSIWTCGGLAGIRNGHFKRNRPAWHEAARQVARGGVAYIEHERQDYYGREVWQAARVRAGEVPT
jgi:hypothetical protein